jgi:glyoxylase-like metal-dependent hydrolase (beta-lactamase superfamily II)
VTHAHVDHLGDAPAIAKLNNIPRSVLGHWGQVDNFLAPRFIDSAPSPRPPPQLRSHRRKLIQCGL